MGPSNLLPQVLQVMTASAIAFEKPLHFEYQPVFNCYFKWQGWQNQACGRGRHSVKKLDLNFEAYLFSYLYTDEHVLVVECSFHVADRDSSGSDDLCNLQSSGEKNKDRMARIPNIENTNIQHVLAFELWNC